MVEGIFEDFADEINAEIAKNVSKSVSDRNREIAKRLIVNGKLPDEDIVECSGISVEDVIVLRSQKLGSGKKSPL